MMENFDSYNFLAGLIYRVEDIYNNTDDGLLSSKQNKWMKMKLMC